jgi:hypothetical protein
MADQQSDSVPVDEPDDKPHFHPWPDLLVRKHREMIVERLIPVAGVTTIVGQPGEGKTTLAIALALSIESGVEFAKQLIKPRPVIWIAGEGQEDLRPLYEAWNKLHPGSAAPQGGFFDGPLNFFDGNDTDELIAKIKAFPPDKPAPLIITDALADMMDGGDEDRAKDMNRIYGNVWRVVRETGASFLIIHHAGWEGKREKGSIAIRAKSDMVVLVNLDPVGMTLNLTWLKNRRGPKFKDVGFQVEPVAVEGFAEEVLVVTGVEVAATGTAKDDAGGNTKDAVKEAKVAAFEVLQLSDRYKYNAWQRDTRERLRVKTNNPEKGLGNDTFRDAVAELVNQGTAVKVDGYYELSAQAKSGCIPTTGQESIGKSTPTPDSYPYRGVGVSGVGVNAPGVTPGAVRSGSNKSRKAENPVEKNEQGESEDTASVLDSAAELLIGKKAG